MDNTIIKLSNVTKLYGGSSSALQMLENGSSKSEVYQATGTTTALYNVSLSIQRGEIFVIIGLSGSGKSTLVRCLNGLHLPTSGSVDVNGKSVQSLSGEGLRDFRRSEISMVFQHFGLMDHRTVAANIAYGLEVRGVSKKDRLAKASEMANLVGLGGLEKEPIHSLSGGMKQRVGIARALASDPEVLLMDEPFSALDPLVRNDMQLELLSIQRKLGKTVVFITHDINEAFKLGDRVAIMRDGQIVQIDTPEGMLANPADSYVEEFIKNADRSRILTARNIMLPANHFVTIGDDPKEAVDIMYKTNQLGICVVDKDGNYLGSLSKQQAQECSLSAINESLLDPECKISDTTLIRSLIPLAAQKALPLGVTDYDGKLIGIVNRSCVLNSFT